MQEYLIKGFLIALIFVFHWKYNLDDIDVSEEIVVDTLPVKKSS